MQLHGRRPLNYFKHGSVLVCVHVSLETFLDSLKERFLGGGRTQQLIEHREYSILIIYTLLLTERKNSYDWEMVAQSDQYYPSRGDQCMSR